MKNINYDEKLVNSAKEGEIKVFDFYGNNLRYTERLGWEVEYSQHEGERKLFRPEVVVNGRWYPYDTEMGIYVK